MFRTHFYPEPILGIFLAAAAAYEIGWNRWLVERGVPFEGIALASGPTPQTRVIGRLLCTISALCFALAAAVCFRVTPSIPDQRLSREFFDIMFAVGFFSLGIWCIYRLALSLRYLFAKASRNERPLVTSAAFYWLGTGLFFPLFALNQVRWLL